MADRDRTHWDAKHRNRSTLTDYEPRLPAVFAPLEHEFPTAGMAIDIACGTGRAAAWLAERGLTVHGFDISPVAIGAARDLADVRGVGERCRFDVWDLDDDLPDGPPADVIVCHRFWDANLDGVIIERLAPGGVLAIAALSEVGHGPGPFRAPPGALRAAFAALSIVAEDEANGEAWLVAIG